MRIIGKLIVVLTGTVVGISLGVLTLLMVSSDRLPFVFGLVITFIMYFFGWLASIFATKQRLLFIAITIYLGYFVYEVGLVTLYQKPSQFTLTFVLLIVMYIGMALSKKKKET